MPIIINVIIIITFKSSYIVRKIVELGIILELAYDCDTIRPSEQLHHVWLKVIAVYFVCSILNLLYTKLILTHLTTSKPKNVGIVI